MVRTPSKTSCVLSVLSGRTPFHRLSRTESTISANPSSRPPPSRRGGCALRSATAAEAWRTRATATSMAQGVAALAGARVMSTWAFSSTSFATATSSSAWSTSNDPFGTKACNSCLRTGSQLTSTALRMCSMATARTSFAGRPLGGSCEVETKRQSIADEVDRHSATLPSSPPLPQPAWTRPGPLAACSTSTAQRSSCAATARMSASAANSPCRPPPSSSAAKASKRWSTAAALSP
mmetsp:Transcript_68384/g.172355  ORF Transcript_68384/g.172355 Transcript_68384/m.172355 type:complete len:236 (-) Transcript_68384:789-1496(-)